MHDIILTGDDTK